MGGSRFAVYSAPFTPADIYDIQTASALDGILLVGDDFSGYCIGYDTRSGWCFGGVNGCGEFSPEPRVATFTQFIEDWFFG